MHDDLYDGLADEIVEGTTILLDRGWSADRVLNEALVEGMRIVGIDFRDGILFVPEVLLAANAMKAGMAILRPLLAETGAEPIGKVVIGTVKGDIHDIGKNLVAMMLEGAGFEVFDIGINSDVDKFLAALEEHQPDILGLSALLTTTMPYMKVVIDTLAEQGPARRLHRARRRCAAERGVRRGRRRRRLLPRRGGRRRDGQGAGTARRAPARRRTAGPVRAMTAAPLVIACGALATELRAVLAGQGLDGVEVRYLPANLHNRPEQIVPALREADRDRGEPDRDVFVAYADCGTGGALDAFPRRAAEHRRLPGAHCYEFFAGERPLRRAARRRAGHLLPHRLPRQALRRARVAGSRPRPPPVAAARVLRQLPAGRAPVAVATTRVARRRRRAAAIAWASRSSTSTPGSRRSPPRSPSASPRKVA